jgi:triacylglycerol lipase
MEVWLSTHGFRPLAPDLAPNNGASGLDDLAIQLRSFADDNLPDGQPFDLVGFSMGGIVARYYVQRLGGIERVRRFITISAPHRGTYVAYAMGNKGAKQMRPGSMFLEDLNRDVAMLERVHFTSIWTPFDLMIVPASSSRISVGQGYICPVALHRWMLRSRRSLDLTTRLLRA